MADANCRLRPCIRGREGCVAAVLQAAKNGSHLGGVRERLMNSFKPLATQSLQIAFSMQCQPAVDLSRDAMPHEARAAAASRREAARTRHSAAGARAPG